MAYNRRSDSDRVHQIRWPNTSCFSQKYAQLHFTSLVAYHNPNDSSRILFTWFEHSSLLTNYSNALHEIVVKILVKIVVQIGLKIVVNIFQWKIFHCIIHQNWIPEIEIQNWTPVQIFFELNVWWALFVKVSWMLLCSSAFHLFELSLRF